MMVVQLVGRFGPNSTKRPSIDRTQGYSLQSKTRANGQGMMGSSAFECFLFISNSHYFVLLFGEFITFLA